jgi:hypothetical protein
MSRRRDRWAGEHPRLEKRHEPLEAHSAKARAAPQSAFHPPTAIMSAV